MRAAVLHEFNAPMVIEEVELPPLSADELRVEVTASGVCHSDVMVASGGTPYPAPIVLGHEGAGRVVEVGDSVTGFKVGDRVVAAFTPICGQCFYCVNGHSNLCVSQMEMGMPPKVITSGGDKVSALCNLGTFSEAMTVHQSSLVKVETSLPDEHLALLGCGVSTGVGAVLNTAQVTAGSTVVVIGCGGVGLSVIQGAVIAGAARIFAVDPVGSKRDLAQRFGATDVVDPGSADLVDVVKSATGGRGADYTFEVVGRPETLMQAFNAARPGGTTVMVGLASVGAEMALPVLTLMVEERRLLGSNFGSISLRRDLPGLIALAESGRLDIESMVSRTIALDDVNEAFAAMEAGDVIRSVIV